MRTRATLLGALLLVGCPKQSDAEDPSVRSVSTTFAYIESQIEMYAADHRRAPSPEEGLGVLFGGETPKDPWGNPIVYENPGPEGYAFDLVSWGADGQPGGKKSDADLRWSELK